MSVSRTRRTAQNATMGFIYQLSSMILSFVSRIVFIRTIGVEYLGLNGVFADVLNLLSMADLGFSTAMAYSFYKPLADRDEEKIASLIAFYKKLYNIIAVVVLILGLACIPFLRLIVRTENDIPLLEVYYLFSLIGVVASYLWVYKTILLTADQKDYMVVRIRMITNITKVLMQILVLVLWRNYILYLAVNMVFGIAGNLMASRKAEKEYPYIKDIGDYKVDDKTLRASIIDNMKSVFIYKVSTTVFSATDNIIISAVVSTIAVGLYSNYLMLSQKILLMEQIFFSSMVASIGNVIAKEDAKKKYDVFRAVQSVSLIFCGIITTGYALLSSDFIKVCFGQEYTLPRLVVMAVTVNAYFSCALQPLWLYRDATGLYRKTKYVMLIATIENVVLSIIMGRILGIAGVIFASAISRLTTYFWYEPRLLFKEYFERGAGRYFVTIFLNVLFCGLAIVIFGFAFSGLKVTGWGSLILKSVLVGGLSAVLFFLIYFRTEGAGTIIRKVRSIIGSQMTPK